MKRALLAAALVACSASRSPTPAPRTHWIVVAPHPDDEALIASGIVRRAVEEGRAVDVILMTNGDWNCVVDGHLRQRESLAAMAALGLGPEHVHFLGYPDGGLSRLGHTPLAQRRIIDGACTTGDTTYGTATSHAYTHENAVADLAALLGELAPTDIATTHPEDTHPDHATTYALVRAAVDRLPDAPVVHRAIVHNGDCWPTGTAPHEPCPRASIAPDQPSPPLSGRLRGYVATEHILVPDSCRDPDPAKNRKVRAIAAHRSQTRGTLESYLFAFAKRDEDFFPERYVHTGAHWVRPNAGVRAAGYVVTTDAKEATLQGPNGLVRHWPLPNDASANEPLEVSVEPRPEDGTTEVTVRLRGDILGEAVEVTAFPNARPAPSEEPTAGSTARGAR